jgi:hypothetical protein
MWQSLCLHGVAVLCKKARDTAEGLAKRGGKGKGNIGSGPAKERISSTPQDADRYLKGLTDQRGVLNYKGKTRDGHDHYEFMKKCEYNGVKFKKGDFISRDTCHHEWEWFRGKDYHKGAIESKTGTRYKDGQKSRILKVK